MKRIKSFDRLEITAFKREKKENSIIIGIAKKYINRYPVLFRAWDKLNEEISDKGWENESLDFVITLNNKIISSWTIIKK